MSNDKNKWLFIVTKKKKIVSRNRSSLGQDSCEPAREKKFLLFDVLMNLRDFTIREISAIKISKLGKVLRNLFL